MRQTTLMALAVQRISGDHLALELGERLGDALMAGSGRGHGVGDIGVRQREHRPRGLRGDGGGVGGDYVRLTVGGPAGLGSPERVRAVQRGYGRYNAESLLSDGLAGCREEVVEERYGEGVVQRLPPPVGTTCLPLAAVIDGMGTTL
jgi:hypothetical protein